MTEAKEIEELKKELDYYKTIIKAPVNMAVRKLSDDYQELRISYAEKLFELAAMKLENSRLKDLIKRSGA